MTNDSTGIKGIIESSAEQEAGEYKAALASAKFDGHPGEKYLLVGFQEGFKRGGMVGVGAIASGLSVVIGQIDNGLLPTLDDVKSSLIQLRNVANRELGL